ncbi:lipopolysaccharide biosynthesis protein [Actinomycetota bacterium]
MSTTVAKGARSGGLSVLSSALTIVIQLGSVVVLAHLLRPADFGLIAMVQVFLAIGQLLGDLGVSNSALQQKRLTAQQSSNLFWINVALSLAIMVALVLTTPLIVDFYDEPRLSAVIPALAVSILVYGATAQIRVHLARAMRFRPVILSTLVATALAAAIAIGLAMAGYGYWALVAQILVVAIVSLAILWVAARWRPQPFRRGHGTSELVRTGLHYWVGGMLYTIESSATNVVIGRSFNAAALGQYNRASQLILNTVDGLVVPLRQIVLPTLNSHSAERDESEGLLLHVQAAVGIPLMAFLAAAAGTADALIPLALGPGWEPAIGLFRILAFAGCFSVLGHIALWAYMFTESSRRNLMWKLTTTPLFVCAIALGTLFGLNGIAWSFVAANALTWAVGIAWLPQSEAVPKGRLLLMGVSLFLAVMLASSAAAVLVGALAGHAPVGQVVAGALAAVAVLLLLLTLVPDTRASLVFAMRLARQMARR